MMPAAKYSYLSSRLVREVAQLGGPIDCLVPEIVGLRLREKIDVAHKFGAADKLASSSASQGKNKFRKRKA